MLNKTISAIAKRISSGLTPLRSNSEFWQNGTIPWLKTEQLGEKFIYDTAEKISETALKKSSLKIYPPNTISIAMYGEGKTRGNVSIIKNAMATNQACCNIELDPNLADFEYVYYFLKTQYKELRSLSSGVRKNLNSDDIRNFVIRLPNTLKEQKNIASILSSLDAKIECNKRINAELEAMAKMLYDYWFVQFDFPDENGKPYKSSGGEMVYNEVLKREIPNGWISRELQSITSLIRRGISPKYTEAGGICVLNQKCIREQRVLFEEARRHSGNVVDTDERLLLINDVLINSTGVGTLGRVAFVKRLAEEKTVVDAHITVVRADPKAICPEYLAWTMLSSQRYIESAANGSTGQVELGKTFLEDFRILLPEESVQKKYKEFVIPLVKEMSRREQENEYLLKLRDWLLPMLMNGQATVADHTNKNGVFPLPAPSEVNCDQRFTAWRDNQALAARGSLDEATLRDIFDAMDDDDK